jgi:inhibitor of KinA sporulation pathway (predicted exonuclease)
VLSAGAGDAAQAYNVADLLDAGLTWQGRAHCGLHDARNTAALMVHLVQAAGLTLQVCSCV